MKDRFVITLWMGGYRILDTVKKKTYLQAGWDHASALEMAEVLNEICSQECEE